MKRAVIVHCWGGEPNYAWYPWVAKQLEAKDFTVSVPEMPDAEEPQLKKWLEHLQDVVGTPDEELVLIGHSVGCATIMRYLETLSEEQRVGKVIFVAGYTDAIGFRELENFFTKPFQFEKIKAKSIEGFVAIQSDDDPFVTEQYGNRLEEELGAELIVIEGAGHMSGLITEKDSCTELPEVVEAATGVKVKTSKKIRLPKSVRHTLVGVLALLILVGGAGIGYTYYMDKHTSATNTTTSNSADEQPAAAIKPAKPAPNAPESTAIQLLTSPAARGSTVAMSVKTQPTSKCTILVTYYNNVPAPATTSGLAPQIADDFGTVSWNWIISKTAPIGKGSVKVTCTYNKKVSNVIGDLQVTAQ